MTTPTNTELQAQCKYRRDHDDWDRTCDDRCEMNRMMELLLGRVRAAEKTIEALDLSWPLAKQRWHKAEAKLKRVEKICKEDAARTKTERGLRNIINQILHYTALENK